MKRIIIFISLLVSFATGFAQTYPFADTAALNTYIRNNIRDKRPEKVTADQIRTGMLGITKFLLIGGGGTSLDSVLMQSKYQADTAKQNIYSLLAGKLSSVDTTNISNFYLKVRGLHSGTSPITYNNTSGIIGITQATTSTNGYLSSTDWNTFNNKSRTLNEAVSAGNQVFANDIDLQDRDLIITAIDLSPHIPTITLHKDGDFTIKNYGNNVYFENNSGLPYYFDNNLNTSGNFVAIGTITSSPGYHGGTYLSLLDTVKISKIGIGNASTDSVLLWNPATGIVKKGRSIYNYIGDSTSVLRDLISSGGYTDEQAQDAVGAMVSSEFTYTDATPLLSINAIAQSKITNLVSDLAGKQTALSGTGFVKISGTTISYDNSTYLTSIDTGNISNFSSKVRTRLSAGTGISYNNTTGVITNSAPDQTVGLTAGSGIGVSGTYPNFTITNNGVTSVNGNTGALTMDTGYVANFYQKVRSLFSAGSNITINNGVIASTGGGGITYEQLYTYLKDSITLKDTIKTGGGIVSTLTASGKDSLHCDSTIRRNSLASGKIWLGYNGDTARAVTPSGDITIDNNGVTTIGASKVTNAMLAGSIAYSKLSLTGAILNTDLAGSIANSKLANSTIGLSLGTSGTDANVSGSPASLGGSLTLNLPTASASNRGLISSADWTAFNNKLSSVDTGNISNFYVKVRSLHAGTAPITYNNTSGVIGITQATTSTNGYLSSADWNTFNGKQGALTLTTTGTSGAATLVGNTLNIPQYSAGGSSSLTSTYVGYGDGSNALTGEAAFNYNSTTNVLSADTVSTSKVKVGANTITSGSNLLNISSNGVTNLKIGTDPNYSNYTNIWPGGITTPNSTNYAWEMTNDGSEVWFNAASGGYLAFTVGNNLTLPILVKGSSTGIGYTSGSTLPSLFSVNGNAYIGGTTRLAALTTNGFVKTGSSNGTLSVSSTVNLASEVTGTLGFGNGGTGATSLTSGSVLFSNGTAISQDNSNFFWDNTNKRLGIGTASPGYDLAIEKTVASSLMTARIVNNSSTGSACLSALGNGGSGGITITGFGTSYSSSGASQAGNGLITAAGSMYLSANDFRFYDNNVGIGLGTTAPSAWLHITAGTASKAPIKLTSGTNLSTTQAGAIEYDGSHLYFTATNGGTRHQLDQQVSTTLSTTTAGSFTPTTVTTSNASVTVYSTAYYTQVGNIVTVYGNLTANSTSGGSNSYIDMTVPITSTYSDQNDGHGVLNIENEDTYALRMRAINNGSNVAMRLYFKSTVTAGRQFTYSYSYIVH